ncbi:FUSC family protein [Chryseobacterium profundimaris]|uniref:FUSC family protein n=1 Tax=Chryseobacterium profundimaris TaxID=1387275 RepID=UPI0024B6944F|nr:FUSC family protein [Chryseobacterium profundimaris]
MNEKDLKLLTNKELLDEEKKLKSFSLLNALLIGFLAGIILVSIFLKSYTLVLLIPLFFIYQLHNNPKNKRLKAIQEILKDRKLK